MNAFLLAATLSITPAGAADLDSLFRDQHTVLAAEMDAALRAGLLQRSRQFFADGGELDRLLSPLPVTWLASQ